MIKDNSYYRQLNERFDQRFSRLIAEFKYLATKVGGVYCFRDYIAKELELKGSDIMHNDDVDFEYKVKFGWKVKR